MVQQGDISPGIASLKRATREAIEAAGGLDGATRETRAGRTQLGRCQSQHHDDTLSLRDALALDEITLGRGGPFILKAYARLLEMELVAKAEAVAAGETPAGIVVALTAAVGNVAGLTLEAVADGRVCPKERRAMVEALYTLESYAIGMRQHLEAEGGA